MKKVLIAEDHPGISETYKLILESEGYQVVQTTNGEQCVSEFDAELQTENEVKSSNKAPFDLVVLDYHMPYKDGIDVATHILSTSPYQRILIASSYPKEIITKSAQHLRGHIELLLKPFDLQQFEDAVQQRSVLPLIGSTQEIVTQSGQNLVMESQG